MSKVKVIFSLAILFFIATQANAQVEKYQSLFIYNFSKYIKWPDDMNSGQFVIGVLGDSPIYDHLKSMADGKRQTQGMNLVIKKFNNSSEVEKCHILYVSAGHENDVASIESLNQTKSTLLITYKPGMAKKGATINFIEESGKIKFELNQATAEEKGLKVAGSLVALSVPV